MRQREEGVCYAFSKADGNAYAVARSEYPRLVSEWMAGRAFFTGTGFYGSAMVLRLGDIVAVEECTAESLAAARADKAADQREDSIE